MSNYYAQIDTNNIVVGVSELHSEETYDHLIQIDYYNISLLGKQYDPTTNTFIDRVKTLDEIKQDKDNELLQSFNESFTKFTSSALGQVNAYPIDGEAQENLKVLEDRMMANPNKNVFSFYTFESRNYVDHTRDQFIVLLDDAESFRITQGRKLNDLKNQVDDIYNDTTLSDADKEMQIKAIVW